LLATDRSNKHRTHISLVYPALVAAGFSPKASFDILPIYALLSSLKLSFGDYHGVDESISEGVIAKLCRYVKLNTVAGASSLDRDRFAAWADRVRSAGQQRLQQYQVLRQERHGKRKAAATDSAAFAYIEEVAFLFA
jgi:hypothetical protein